MNPVVAVIAPGMMGAAVAGRLRASFARGTVAAPRLARQRAGPAHVRAAGHRDEREHGEDQPDVSGWTWPF